MDNSKLNAKDIEDAAVTTVCYNCHKTDIFDKIEFIGNTGIVKHYGIDICVDCKDIVLPKLQWLYDRFKPITDFIPRQLLYIPEPEKIVTKYCCGCDKTLEIEFFGMYRKTGKYRKKCRKCNRERDRYLENLRRINLKQLKI